MRSFPWETPLPLMRRGEFPRNLTGPVAVGLHWNTFYKLPPRISATPIHSNLNINTPLMDNLLRYHATPYCFFRGSRLVSSLFQIASEMELQLVVIIRGTSDPLFPFLQIQHSSFIYSFLTLHLSSSNCSASLFFVLLLLQFFYYDIKESHLNTRDC